MHSLDEYELKDGDAFDNAINYCTGGKIADKTALINQFMNDLNNSATYTDFLRDYCDIDLTNADTGAITGSDAGGGSTKTAESVVPESSSHSTWTLPSGSSSTIGNLEINWPTTGADKQTLTAAEKHIMAGLNSEWIQQSVDLIKETYGIDFNQTGTLVRSISVKFTEENNSVLAYVEYSPFSDGKTYSLTLNVNMNFYGDIDLNSEDGDLLTKKTTYLDRTIAHEFTHAIMAANIDYFNSLPLYVKEGTAELTHGIDDERGGNNKIADD